MGFPKSGQVAKAVVNPNPSNPKVQCSKSPVSHVWLSMEVTVGQSVAGLSFNQGVGGSIPSLVDVSLSKTLNPELLPVAASTVYECNRIASRFG